MNETEMWNAIHDLQERMDKVAPKQAKPNLPSKPYAPSSSTPVQNVNEYSGKTQTF